jgi:hypothetical protein
MAAAHRASVLSQGVQPAPFGKNAGKANGHPAGPGAGRGPRPSDAPSPASGEGSGAPRQLANVKGAAGAMGPPPSPSLANRNVNNVKKSESAGSSPALQPNTIPNGMGDRSRTPSSGQQQMMKQPGAPPSPRSGPATRPQSAAPTSNQGPSMQQGPPPPNSAPPMLSQPTQSPPNGMPYTKGGFNHTGGPFGSQPGEFDFGPELDFSQLTSEFFPEDVDQILNMGSLNEWPSE